ncbi:MAG: arylesterase [Alishewanella agri]|jgi:acyl-CoA thioesterase-1|uniref:Acyl-CoA thioesterase I n=1 Tax=Alishewanella agri BL06 TaxID=1195246 RepID=I9DW19_9ALTE|nr:MULTISPECIES: arylesterase [Alishewanella]EIW90375.1 acyl-CoA thioesterase I [Alishewanella agri BL06]KRS22225.1 arylesterase [Alishewanella sp. WH16-1]MDD4863082.1 arylesterase [Alishewanella agri]OYW91724.1 MAG: arylesterase [Alishewanella sp. 32-51-5]
MRIIFVLIFCLFSQPTLAQKLLILGDSLSAAYGLQEHQGWPALLAADSPIELVNGSISGETTGGGLARLPALLKQHQPTWVLIELGGNDGLRGFDPQLIANNLQQMINLVKQHNAEPLLMQIRIPPNYGPRYVERFTGIYPQLAAANEIPLWPFFMDEIAVRPELMMQDGIHPNAKAQPLIRDLMLPLLQQLTE